METFICRICDTKFSESDIPADAEKLMGSSRGSVLYRWAGEIHDLRPERTIQRQKFAAHKRFHLNRNISVSGCSFCDEKLKQPEPTPIEPNSETDQGVEIFLSEEAPLGEIPVVEEVAPAATPPESEFHDNTMSYAFSKYKKEINTNG